MEKLKDKFGKFVLSKTTIFKANSKIFLMQGALPPFTPRLVRFASLCVPPTSTSFRPPQKWYSCAPVYTQGLEYIFDINAVFFEMKKLLILFINIFLFWICFNHIMKWIYTNIKRKKSFTQTFEFPLLISIYFNRYLVNRPRWNKPQGFQT